MPTIKKHKKKYIPWWQPEIGKYEYSLVKDVFLSNFPNEGKVTDSFREKLVKLLNIKYVLVVPSGTSALFLSLKSLGISYGDEVIVPDASFIATANAVEMTGAKAVLVDIDPKTLTIDPAAIQKAITKKTKAIIPVHVSGRAAAIKSILSIARKKHIPVIEDAAEAFLSCYQNKPLGTFGDIGCYSLAPTKTITTGQGGIIVTNDKKRFETLRLMKDHGRLKRGSGGDDIHVGIGYNFKYPDILAAVGLGQLRYIHHRIKRMKRNYILYRKYLNDVKEITFFDFDIDHGEFPLWIDVKAKKRDELYNYLLEQNMHCRRFWHPIHRQSYYKMSDTAFPNCTKLSYEILWLPSSFTLTDTDIEYVANAIKHFYGYKL